MYVEIRMGNHNIVFKEELLEDRIKLSNINRRVCGFFFFITLKQKLHTDFTLFEEFIRIWICKVIQNV